MKVRTRIYYTDGTLGRTQHVPWRSAAAACAYLRRPNAAAATQPAHLNRHPNPRGLIAGALRFVQLLREFL